MGEGADLTIVGGAAIAAAQGSGELTDELLGSAVWSDAMLQSLGIPIVDAPLVTVGGGMGSLALVDTLRIAGVLNSGLGTHVFAEGMRIGSGATVIIE